MRFTRILTGFMNGAYDCKIGTGLVAITNEPTITTDVEVCRGVGPFCVGAGKEMPYFAKGEYVNNPPMNMEEIVIEVASPVEKPVVIAWGLKSSWLKALQAIGSRPYFRVMSQNRFKGQMMSAEVRETISFEGSLEEMIAASPRTGEFVSKKDRFAPIYQAMKGITAMNRVEKRTKKGMTAVEDKWIDWEDCRPFPFDVIYRLNRVVDGKVVEQLGVGTALQLNWKYPLGSSTDKLLAYKPEELVRERRDAKPGKDIHSSEYTWTECAEFRPKLELPPSWKEKVQVQTEVTAPTTQSATTTQEVGQVTAPTIQADVTPLATPVKKSVAMPKRPKKALSTPVSSFATLDQVVPK